MNQNKTDRKSQGLIIHQNQIDDLIDIKSIDPQIFTEIVYASLCYFRDGTYPEFQKPESKWAFRSYKQTIDYDKQRYRNKCEQNRYNASQKSTQNTIEQDNISLHKIHYAENVALTETEYNQLVSEYGEQDTKRMIDKLSNYKCAKGATYESDYHAILDWVIKWLDEQKKKESEAAACSDPEENSSYDRDEVEEYWNKR